MITIAIVVAYFGKLPKYFPLWLKACEFNPSIDFLIFTDDATTYSYPKNIKVHKMSFSQLKACVEECFDFAISLDAPYKLCDYKVAYGEIFSDFLNGYDFWGHCDLDQLMGSIRTFVTDDLLTNYDRIYRYGHLTLYRNDSHTNKIYQLSGSCNWVPYKEVFSSPIDYAFDEVGMQYILKAKTDIRAYNKMDGMDLSWIPDHLELIKHEDKDVNFQLQAFYWQKGHVYQCSYDKDGKCLIREGAYIHFSHRHMHIDLDEFSDECGIYVAKSGFVPKIGIAPPSIEEIHKINPPVSPWVRLLQKIIINWKYNIVRRMKRKIRLLCRRIKNNVH